MYLIVTVVQIENTSITNERITLKIYGIRMFSQVYLHKITDS